MFDISLADPVAVWGPAALVVLVAALGLTVAGSPPVRRGVRRLWLAAIFLCGSAAVAGSVWQTQQALDRRAAAAAAPATAAATRSAAVGPAGGVAASPAGRPR